MQGTRWWLICYDVRDAKRLRKTAKRMEGYGERMQYSVFRCWLSPRELQLRCRKALSTSRAATFYDAERR